MRVGVDVGGTFTDVVGWDGERLVVDKLSTTPDQSEAVMRGATGVAPTVEHLLHGTTVATNALLERAGARVGLVTSAGFESLLDIGRQDRPSLYDTFVTRPAPLSAATFGASVRLSPDGHVEHRNDPESLLTNLAAADLEAVAVSLLYGFAAGGVEDDLAAAIRDALPEVPVSLSSRVAPEFREFERSSTTVLNAYLTPVTASYLERLEDRAGDVPIAIMRSSGGVMPVRAAADLPSAVLLSGPAGGVVAAAELGRELSAGRVVSFDMGGTSTDVCRIDGDPEVSYQRSIDGYPCRMPALAVHTVGAGGGSLGWADPGGALRVGPASAGAHPGPASYGRGGVRAAVTDANAHLGRIGGVLADEVSLDLDAAARALEALGEQVGLDVDATAAGMIDVVEAHMARAIRTVTVEEGADPRGAALIAFGGAGGLHAAALAASLGMAKAIIPLNAGVFSALGLLMAPPRVDLAQSLSGQDPLAAADDLLGRAQRAFVDQNGAPGSWADRFVDLRYLGQSHETTVPVLGDWPQVVSRFHQLHERRNGFSRPGDPVEAVTVRATVRGRPAVTFGDLETPGPEGEPDLGQREVWVGGQWQDVPVYRREALGEGWQARGPAVIAGAESTIFVPGGHTAEVGPWGLIELTW